MKRLKVILAAAIVAAATGSASAVPTLTISDGVTTTSVTDPTGDAMYANPAFDSAWNLVIVTGLSKPQAGYGTAANPIMDVNVQAQSLSLSPVRNLTITFSDNFYGPTIGTFQADLTGHVTSGTGQNVTYNTFFDIGNVTGATTSSLTSMGPLPPPTYGPTTALSGPFSQTLYSLTQVITIGGTPAGSPVGTYELDAKLSLVPEPGTVSLLLAGAAAFGVWRRRK
jgi:hypothetical protein